MKKIQCNQLKVGSMLSYVQIILGAIISIAITPIMLNCLGKSEYGILNLAGSSIAYLNLITLGIGNAFIRYNAKYRMQHDLDGEHSLNATFLSIYLIMSVITIIAGVGLIFSAQLIFNNLSPAEIQKTQIIMGITLANMAIALPYSVFTMNNVAYEKFVFAKIIGIVNTVLNPALRLPLLLLGGKSISITVLTAVLHIITLNIEMIYALKVLKVKFKFGQPNWNLIKSLFAFSFFIVLHQVVDMVNWNVDKIILGAVFGTGAVAVYSLGATFNTYIIQFNMAITGVVVPKINRMIMSNTQSTDEINSYFIKISRIQFMMISLIITGFIFFGKAFIQFYYGPKTGGYEDAYYIALLLIVPLSIDLIQNVGIEIQRAMNLHKYRAYIYICIAVLNVAMSIPFATLWGGIGCALATCIAIVLGNGIAVNLFYHFKMKLDMKRYWKEVLQLLSAMIWPIILGIAIKTKVDLSNIGVFVGCIVGYSALYVICMYFFGMNKYEKELFSGKVLSKLKLAKIGKHEKTTKIDNSNDIVESFDKTTEVTETTESECSVDFVAKNQKATKQIEDDANDNE